MDGNEEKKYSVQLLIPKKDKKTVEAIKAAIEEAKELGKTKFGGKIPAKLKLPLRDGDEERPDDPNLEGMFFINANNKNKPGILDRDKNEIMDRDEFYSGCYGRASITFFAFTGKQAGIACALNHLQKLEDGERLDGRTSAEEDFADEYDDLM